jgi:hypothetical protein
VGYGCMPASGWAHAVSESCVDGVQCGLLWVLLSPILKVIHEGCGVVPSVSVSGVWGECVTE